MKYNWKMKEMKNEKMITQIKQKVNQDTMIDCIQFLSSSMSETQQTAKINYQKLILNIRS